VLASTVSWLLLVPLGGTDRLYEAGGLPEVIIYDILTWGGSGTTPITTWWWLATAAPHTTTSFDLVHTAGVAVALLGAMLLLAHLAVSRQLPALRTGLGVLGAAGGMTLTLYSAHIVVMNSALNEIDPTVLYLGQVAAALVFATAWRARTGRGPLEGVVSDVARAAKQRATAGARAPSGPRGRVAAGSAAAHGTPHVKEAAGAPEVGASEG
jgi:hypothetical protein